MRHSVFAGLACIAAAAAPAAATLSEYRYTGTVVAVFGSMPDGVVAGDTVNVRVRFDPATLVDVTAAANAAFGTSYTNILAGTLTAPGSRLDASVGPNSFALGDEFAFFPDVLGGGGEPYVLFNNGAFAGIDYFGVNPMFSAFVTSGVAPEAFDFVGGSFLADGPSYGGFFDYSKATYIANVPEPASWALMVAGFGLVGATLRRRAVACAA